MPLSEHEQRLLEQMERALYAEDPKFATSLQSPADRRGARRRSAIGVVGALLGAGLLVAGVAWSYVVVGVLGFVVMLAGTFFVVASVGRARRPVSTADAAGVSGASAGPVPGPSKAPRRGGFMDRVEERWRRRHEGGHDL